MSLLFHESPIIGFGVAGIICVSAAASSHKITFAFICILVCLLIFYRYTPHKISYDNDTLISPSEGTITYIAQNGKFVDISIFMSVFNNHTQIYPVNGEVIERIYDETGKFAIVVERNKCRTNEKKIHRIRSAHGPVSVTQIAGFLPRRISSSEIVPEEVRAGQYLGMIKFGSRIDISFVGDAGKLKFRESDPINIGDIIYSWL